MSTPASGLMRWGERLRQVPQQALDAVGSIGAPIQHGVESLLGMQRPLQRDTSWMAPVQDVQAAAQTFQKPDMMQMRKPLKESK